MTDQFDDARSRTDDGAASTDPIGSQHANDAAKSEDLAATQAMELLGENGMTALANNAPVQAKQRTAGAVTIRVQRDQFAAALATVRQASVSSILVKNPAMVVFQFGSEGIHLSASRKGITVDTMLKYAEPPAAWPADVSVPIDPLLRLFPWHGRVDKPADSRKWEKVAHKSAGPYKAAIPDEIVDLTFDLPLGEQEGTLKIIHVRGHISVPIRAHKVRRKIVPVPPEKNFPAEHVIRALRIAGTFAVHDPIYKQLDVVTIKGGVACGGQANAMTAYTSSYLQGFELSVAHEQRKPLIKILNRMVNSCGMSMVGNEVVFGFGVTTVRFKDPLGRFNRPAPEQLFADASIAYDFRPLEADMALRTVNTVQPPNNIPGAEHMEPLCVEMDIVESGGDTTMIANAVTSWGRGKDIIALRPVSLAGAQPPTRYFSTLIGNVHTAMADPGTETYGRMYLVEGRMMVEFSNADGIVRHVLGGRPEAMRLSAGPEASIDVLDCQEGTDAAAELHPVPGTDPADLAADFPTATSDGTDPHGEDDTLPASA